MTFNTTIDFSAQFGGQDAADFALPHFRALKVASRGLELAGFPFPKLAFMLRVDGEVNSYGFSGPGYLEIDKQKEYLSIDIGLTQEDRIEIQHVISSAILGSVAIIDSAQKVNSWHVELEPLQQSLDELVHRYRDNPLNN